LSHWSYFIPEVDPCEETHPVEQDPTYSDWSEWEWDSDRGFFFRTRTKTTVWLIIGSDNETVCGERVVREEEEERRRADDPGYAINVECNEAGVAEVSVRFAAGVPTDLMVIEGQGSRHEIGDGGGSFLARPGSYTWIIYRDEEPIDRGGFEVEVCELDPPTLRIGGRCTEDGDSQEIGYVFDDGDFDGARLIITRSDGVEVANVGEGSDFLPARAGDYSWEIIWFNGKTREVLDEGKFTVNKCELTPVPEVTPTPTEEQGCWNTGDNICPGDETPEPPTHPPTGADPGTALPLIASLMGFALAGIGGTILYARRRASR
jgi:hypothetical protein